MSVRDNLKAYLDNELPPAQMEEVRAALENDVALRDELEFLKSIGESIRAQASEPEVVGLEATLMVIRNPKAGFWSPVIRRPLMTGAFAIVLIAFISAIIFPVFSQAKNTAKNTERLVASRMAPDEGSVRDQAKALGGKEFTGSETFAAPAAGAAPIETGKAAHGWAKEAPDRKRSVESAAPMSELNSKNVYKYAREKAKSRMVVSNAQMSVKVENAQKAQSEAQSIIVGYGGYVENSNSSQLEGQLPTATSVFRVPCTQFDAAIQRIRKLGSVLTENIQADDVTLEYADINARLKVIRIEEQQYLDMLRGAKKTGEIMAIRDRLSQVRQQIESMDAQQKALMDQASLSTISVTFEQRVEAGKPEVPDSWADETWGSAVNGLNAVGRFFGRVGIFLFVYSPLWLGALIIYFIAKRRSR